MLRRLFLLLLALSSFGVMAETLPDFQASYVVRLNGIQAGELETKLETQASGLRRYSSYSRAKGLFSLLKPDIVEETSIWRDHDNEIQPQHYLYERSGGKKEKRLEMEFDWQQAVVHIDDRQHPWQLELEPGTLDKLVYQFSLMRDLEQGRRDLSYRIADGGRLKTYQMRVLGEETIVTPLGQIHTVKLRRDRDKPSDRQTTLWCAPALGYLPVRLQHEEDSTVFTAELNMLDGIDMNGAFTPLSSTSPIGTP